MDDPVADAAAAGRTPAPLASIGPGSASDVRAISANRGNVSSVNNDEGLYNRADCHGDSSKYVAAPRFEDAEPEGPGGAQRAVAASTGAVQREASANYDAVSTVLSPSAAAGRPEHSHSWPLWAKDDTHSLTDGDCVPPAARDSADSAADGLHSGRAAGWPGSERTDAEPSSIFAPAVHSLAPTSSPVDGGSDPAALGSSATSSAASSETPLDYEVPSGTQPVPRRSRALAASLDRAMPSRTAKRVKGAKASRAESETPWSRTSRRQGEVVSSTPWSKMPSADRDTAKTTPAAVSKITAPAGTGPQRQPHDSANA